MTKDEAYELLWGFVNTMEFDVKHNTYEEDIEYFIYNNYEKEE